MDSEEGMAERGPARSGPRDSLFLLTSLKSDEGTPLGRARVRNLSATGLMADCERPVPAGARILFELRGIGRVSGSVVWSREDKIGVAFDQEIDPQLARKPVAAGEPRRSVPTYLRLHQLNR
ncbi:MAG TPA: PilZ domain-containing protein [Sphingobium sp.]|nr:PilZ domain-containing protein [Sphingobium sp.]